MTIAITTAAMTRTTTRAATPATMGQGLRALGGGLRSWLLGVGVAGRWCARQLWGVGAVVVGVRRISDE
ncbi:hypothetical protein A5679_23260 [Mycobacterium scrofulaceum]|uniref:Uncharacterized protein n=1 Tax=Mycobacterium scrofulaceum TaxID=1783 RepID=A0A1A2UVX4_MYCSC|nr:hypothetical protein A5679_23260 [Mycobacterium scrofulaceum]